MAKQERVSPEDEFLCGWKSKYSLNLIDAIQSHDNEKVQKLLVSSKSETEANNEHGNTFLHVAAKFHALDIFELLTKEKQGK